MLVVSHMMAAVLLLVELHINIDLHQVSLVRISLASEKGCTVSDKISEVSLSKDLVIDLVLCHLIDWQAFAMAYPTRHRFDLLNL